MSGDESHSGLSSPGPVVDEAGTGGAATNAPGPDPSGRSQQVVVEASVIPCAVCGDEHRILLDLDCGHSKVVDEGSPDLWLGSGTDCRTCPPLLSVDRRAEACEQVFTNLYRQFFATDDPPRTLSEQIYDAQRYWKRQLGKRAEEIRYRVMKRLQAEWEAR